MLVPVGGFAGGSHEDRSRNVNSERSINLYMERSSGTAPSEWVLRQSPGYERVVTLPGVVRGLKHINGRAFAVGGDQLYELDADFQILGAGSVAGISGNDTRQVTWMTNGEAGQQLGVISGGQLTVYDLGTGSYSVVASFPLSRVGAWLDTYGISLAANSSQFAISASNDITSWDALEVALRSFGADSVVAFGVLKRELIIHGNETSEVWYNSGAGNMPFVPKDGVFLEVGSAAERGGAVVGGRWYWLARSAQGGATVQRMEGWTPQKVSTHQMDAEFAGYARVDDARAFGMEWDGHPWFVLTFPSVHKTWIYDVATNEWHERLTWESERSEYREWRGGCHMFAFGRHLIGDPTSGDIYALSNSVYADGDRPLRWMRRTPHIVKNRERVTYSAVQLDMEAGIGLTTGQGSDPQVMLRWSTDDGHSWSQEHWRTAGARGARRTRVKWNRLGTSRARMFEVAGSDPVPITLLNLLVEATA